MTPQSFLFDYDGVPVRIFAPDLESAVHGLRQFYGDGFNVTEVSVIEVVRA